MKLRTLLWIALAGVVAMNIALWPAYRLPPHAFFDDRPFWVAAHRGGAEIGPENTLQAGARAAALGADALEYDLQLTSDRALVALHDETLDRTTDGEGPVAALPLEAVQALDAGDGARMPTFQEILAAFPAARLIVEIKPPSPEAAGLTCAAIRAAGAQDRVLVGAFDGATLRAFRGACPEVATSLAADEARTFVILARLRLSRFWTPPAEALLAPESLDGDAIVDANLVRAARQRGLRLLVWTVNDPATMTRLRDLGVDGLITDRPDLAVGVRPAA